MTQEAMPERDPIEEYWALYGKPSPFKSEPLLPFDWPEDTSPWADGRYAFAAILAGLLAMLLMSIPAGASGTTKKHPGTKVKAIEQRETKQSCLPPVRVVGSQWATESGAEESAQKSWAEAVRFSHGEVYMQLDQAIGYQKRCSRSSIQEVVGQTLIRCEVDAAPCRPPFTAGGQ